MLPGGASRDFPSTGKMGISMLPLSASGMLITTTGHRVTYQSGCLQVSVEIGTGGSLGNGSVQSLVWWELGEAG